MRRLMASQISRPASTGSYLIHICTCSVVAPARRARSRRSVNRLAVQHSRDVLRDANNGSRFFQASRNSIGRLGRRVLIFIVLVVLKNAKLEKVISEPSVSRDRHTKAFWIGVVWTSCASPLSISQVAK